MNYSITFTILSEIFLKIINKKTQFVQEITVLYNFSDNKKNRIEPSRWRRFSSRRRLINQGQVTHQITSSSSEITSLSPSCDVTSEEAIGPKVLLKKSRLPESRS